MRLVLLNRLTKCSILLLVAAVICVALAVAVWRDVAFEPYCFGLAILLAACSVVCEGYGAYESRRFVKKDALGVYQATVGLLTQLRTLGEALHGEYGYTPEGLRKFVRDERYRRLMKELTRVKAKCRDFRLGRKLRKVIEMEKLATLYSIGPTIGIPGHLERADRDIRDYIDQNFATRGSPALQNGA